MAMNSPTVTCNTEARTLAREPLYTPLNTPGYNLQSPGRRTVLRNALSLWLGAAGAFTAPLSIPVSAGVAHAGNATTPNTTAPPATVPNAGRLALLIGNGDYPVPHDLPPIAKNVMDLGEALAFRGFDVTQAMNLDESSLQATVTEFVKRVAAAPGDTVTLFYYAGHGLQVDSNNLLLGSGSNPTAPRKDLIARSLVLQQKLLAALPPRPQALNITVIDACRTDLRNALGDGEGLNQVEAPLGSLVCFSTGAGRPAVSPASADQNTFYTAALVRLLREAAGQVTFNDLFQLVKTEVQHTMLNHPLAAIRQLAQNPFIADNTRVQVPLSWGGSNDQGKAEQPLPPAEQAAWETIQNTDWPVDLLRLCNAFLATYPDSAQAQTVGLLLAGAKEALRILRSKEVKLFKTSFVIPPPVSQASSEQLPHSQRTELMRAARGDKDAAARIARLHRALETEQGLLRYVGWLQYASGLGNGIASYELALYYREAAQPLLAAQAEARARQLGYSPPRALGHERK
ncbi:caspase domain-containing protein [Limnobacter thiooxidans]|nr:caspase domain-containing protein [Limnobacter thiooxidans]